MKRVFKWLGIGLAVLIGLVVIAVGATFLVGRSRLANAPDVAVTTVAVPSDPDSISRGEHLARAITGCVGCHGDNLAGTVYIEDPTIGLVPAANLTSGVGGIASVYNDEDWARAIRHGVAADGRTAVVMPSNAYAHLSDEDLGALIAYLKTLPPIDNDLPPRQITFPGTLIFGVLAYADHPVSTINHENVGGFTPAEGNTAEYGEYLALIGGCQDCHGADLAGRSAEEAQNGPPPGPNLTLAGELGGWSEADFMAAMRTGTTPTGRQINDLMPWREYSQMTDTELQAVWAYLKTIEPAVANR